MSYNSKPVAIDCEMVQGRGGQDLLARVSLVNEHGNVILDEYIKPSSPVADYRTWVSGIGEENLRNAPSLSTIKPRVAQAINGRVLVGHTLDKDLGALELNHPENMRRDLGKHEPFKRMNGGQPASLKFLAKNLLNKNIQNGPHSSVEDAIVSMEIYRYHWN